VCGGQSLVDEYAFAAAAAEGAARPYTPPSSYVVGTPMPTGAFSQNLFYVAVSYMLSLVLTMCQLFPVSLLTKAVVVEKEMRLKQTMRIMGLRDSVLYSSWWLSALAQFSVISVLCTAVIKLFVINTAWWIILLYVGLFCLGAISFAFLLSVFFSNAVLSAIVGPIAFFGALLPRYLFFSTNR
jgi:ATP-binding cassette subfamily A (ABC1) protein 3